jgi:hypothetical protein
MRARACAARLMPLSEFSCSRPPFRGSGKAQNTTGTPTARASRTVIAATVKGQLQEQQQIQVGSRQRLRRPHGTFGVDQQAPWAGDVVAGSLQGGLG